MSGATVSLVICGGIHAMVLLKGCFYSTNSEGETYPYCLMDRMGDAQTYRLVKEITGYRGYEGWKIYNCGTTMATAQQFVDIAKKDLKLKWAQSYQSPMENGEESFCL